MSFGKLVVSCPRFGHGHDVLKLEVIVKFRLLFDRDGAALGSFEQLGHALPDRIGETESNNVSGVVPAAMKSIISSYDFAALILSL
jgi:hypothetical protein